MSIASDIYQRIVVIVFSSNDLLICYLRPYIDIYYFIIRFQPKKELSTNKNRRIDGLTGTVKYVLNEIRIKKTTLHKPRNIWRNYNILTDNYT